jgi:hypothetical protein
MCSILNMLVTEMQVVGMGKFKFADDPFSGSSTFSFCFSVTFYVYHMLSNVFCGNHVLANAFTVLQALAWQVLMHMGN